MTTQPLAINRPTLPEWTRWAWSSLTEREYWMPLIKMASQTYVRMERESVAEGIRPAAYQTIHPNNFLDQSAWATRRGLVLIPITQVNVADSYSSASNNFDPSKSIEFRVIITTPNLVAQIQQIPDLANNNTELGKLLGYPECCQKFFLNTWGSGQVDTTFDQYATTGLADGSVEANILWRWLGIRWVSHLPCSFQCNHTIERGRQMRQLMRQRGHHEAAHVIDTVLSWPTRWSGINGIAEIVAPAVKVSTRTDWAPPKDNRRFTRKGRYTKPTKDIWTLNGFTSFPVMFESHEPVVKAIAEFAKKDGTLVDLGCGNGTLLRRSAFHRPDLKLVGYDTNEVAITAAAATGIGDYTVANVKDVMLNEQMTVVMNPARLTELTPTEATILLEELQSVHNIIVYAYGDTLKQRSLAEWIVEARLPVERLLITHASDLVSVGVIER